MTLTELAAALAERGMTITAAESLTAGLFQNRIAKTSSASAIYPGGFITYSNEAKEQILGIPHKLLQQHGAVSEEIAKEMALNCRRLLNTTFGISFTGVGGPGQSEGERSGTVWIGLADEAHNIAKQYNFRGEAEDVLEQAMEAGINLLEIFMKLSESRGDTPSPKTAK